MSTNKSIALSEPKIKRSTRIPQDIKISQKRLKEMNSRLKRLTKKNIPTNDLTTFVKKETKALHRKLVRGHDLKENVKRDERLFSLLSSNASSMFRKIRASKASNTEEIQSLKVGSMEYYGENVKNGFFKSLSDLKSRKPSKDKENYVVNDIMEDYSNILDICQFKKDLPNISLLDSSKILHQMKSTVNDIYSITTLHFINAGVEGVEHFHFLLNCIIDDVNNASIEELNSVYALLLHKGHNKPRNVSNAYRTISTCPMLAKALDSYIRHLHLSKWNKEQAATQYQGEASSHELAALLVTELIQHSLYTLKEPIYLLFLDAMSAYDTVMPKLLIKNMYLAGMEGNSLTSMNHRFTNRQTYVDWAGNLMGPIHDEHGLEQGNIASSDLYKLYNNELLKTTQKSELGIPLKSQVISSVGQADDTVHATNKLTNLSNILHLTMDYCKKYKVTLCAEKTKLLRITNVPDSELEVLNPIYINGVQVKFSESAEHVGILRSSSDGNLPNLMCRISAHKRALGATLFSGIAQRHRANPAVGLKVGKIYGTPVLLSGIASLVLLESELALLDQHLKEVIQNTQKMHAKTPDCVVYFLGGCLPARAEIHLRQLSLFGMVARLQDDPLNIHARNVLTETKKSAKSWFSQIRDTSLQYRLPHPLTILENPPSKETYKRMVKSHILDFWENKFRGEASFLPSLEYCNPSFMSLASPHPIWTTAGGNPHEVAKSIQQARFLSGRYRTEYLSRHWTDNAMGFCLANEQCESTAEDVRHILLDCPAYSKDRHKLISFWLKTPTIEAQQLVLEALSNTSEYLLQFIMDCSVLPTVITASQKNRNILSELFLLTRTWCFVIHRQRMRKLGRWNFQ